MLCCPNHCHHSRYIVNFKNSSFDKKYLSQPASLLKGLFCLKISPLIRQQFLKESITPFLRYTLPKLLRTSKLLGTSYWEPAWQAFVFFNGALYKTSFYITQETCELLPWWGSRLRHNYGLLFYVIRTLWLWLWFKVQKVNSEGIKCRSTKKIYHISEMFCLLNVG